MTSTVPDVTSGQKTEDELWTAYMVALAREQENRRLHEEAWHRYVLTGLDFGSPEQAAYYLVRDLHDASRDAARTAHAAWKRVAYPLHNIPLHDDDE